MVGAALGLGDVNRASRYPVVVAGEAVAVAVDSASFSGDLWWVVLGHFWFPCRAPEWEETVA
jgi:hypothetical protein